MPIRSYTCEYCGHKFERILSRKMFDEMTIDICPQCDNFASADGVELPARRNPAYGIQN